MKNNVAKAMLPLMLMLSMATVGRGQWSHAYYHRVGDTVEQTIPIYYYQWWDWDRYLTTWEFVKLTESFSGGWYAIMNYFYTPTPIKVIGIAGMVKAFSPNYAPDTLPDSLYLYNAGLSGPEPLASVPWRETDSCRYLSITSNGGLSAERSSLDTCCRYMPWNQVERVYEYYFDTSFILTDSFYVGGTMIHGNNIMWATGLNSLRYDCNGNGPSDFLCLFPYHKLVFRNCNVHYGDDGIIHYDLLPGWSVLNPYSEEFAPYIPTGMLMVFPIIEVDTTVPPQGYCQPPENVQVPLTESGTATVTWDGFVNYTNIEVQYGRSDIPVSQWTTVDTNGTMYMITGLDTTIYATYGVRVRASCDNEKKYTPWSDVVYFTIGSPTTGIAAPESELSRSVVLQPNPAREEVTMSSMMYLLQHFEIRNATGILVHSGYLSSRTATISLEGLPAGAYIVTVQTQGGTTTKKLVKQ